MAVLATVATLLVGVLSPLPADAWTAQSSGTTATLYGVSCSTAVTCETAGAGGTIVGTADGGMHWIVQADPASTDLNAVSCSTPSSCEAVGNDIIVGTHTAGTVWGIQLDPNPVYNLTAVACATALCSSPGNATNGCNGCQAAAAVMWTDTAGLVWDQQFTQIDAAFQGVSCPTAATCWVAGHTGSAGLPVIYDSTNGGRNWSLQYQGNAADTLRGISCSTVLACVAAGNPSLYTTDGGTSWSSSPVNLTSVSCVTGTADCEAVGLENSTVSGDSSIFSTANGGQTWSAQTDSAPPLNAISCAIATSCEAVGWNGVILGGP